MRKKNYYILMILSLLFISYSLYYVFQNEINNKNMFKFSNISVLDDLSNMVNITNEDTQTISDKVKKSSFFTYLNETEIRDNFIQDLQNRRETHGKNKITYSKTLEKKAQYCAENYNEECLIEYYQNGIGWQIPWYTDVVGCGNAFGNKNNPDCLMTSLENEEDFGYDIYADLFKRNKIGVGIYHIESSNEVSYWIILE